MSDVVRYLRSRDVVRLLVALLVLTTLLMSPLGAVLLLPERLASTNFDVPVRVVGMAFLAAPSCLARSPGLEVRELSGARSGPALRLAAPLLLALTAVVAVLVGAALVDAPAAPLLRNLLLFQGLAWLASRVHSQLGWLAAAGLGLACVPVAADPPSWAVPLSPVDGSSVTVAGVFLLAGLVALARAPAQRHG